MVDVRDDAEVADVIELQDTLSGNADGMNGGRRAELVVRSEYSECSQAQQNERAAHRFVRGSSTCLA